MLKLGAAFLAVAAVTGACATAGRSGTRVALGACEPGDSLQVRTELLMGRNIPGGGEVSDSAWTEFVGSYVTPRFPDGLTILDAAGQWRNAAGVVERERGKAIIVLHAGDPIARRAVSEIAAEYKRRFRQEAVLVVTYVACVRFQDAG